MRGSWCGKETHDNEGDSPSSPPPCCGKETNGNKGESPSSPPSWCGKETNGDEGDSPSSCCGKETHDDKGDSPSSPPSWCGKETNGDEGTAPRRVVERRHTTTRGTAPRRRRCGVERKHMATGAPLVVVVSLPAFYTDLTLERESIRQIQRAHLVCPLLAVRVSSASLMMVVVVNGGIGSGKGRLVTSNISKFCSHVFAYTNM
jgi:hypothetical protein